MSHDNSALAMLAQFASEIETTPGAISPQPPITVLHRHLDRLGSNAQGVASPERRIAELVAVNTDVATILAELRIIFDRQPR